MYWSENWRIRWQINHKQRSFGHSYHFRKTVSGIQNVKDFGEFSEVFSGLISLKVGYPKNDLSKRSSGKKVATLTRGPLLPSLPNNSQIIIWAKNFICSHQAKSRLYCGNFKANWSIVFVPILDHTYFAKNIPLKYLFPSLKWVFQKLTC